MKQLLGKAALITGASGGIGRALAIKLAEAGANLALSGRDEAKLSEICALARTFGAEAVMLPGDLNATGQPAECVRRAAEAYGRLDILINNAGVVLAKPFESITPEEYDRVMATNVRAPFLLCQAALPYLRKTRGAILNIGSVVSHRHYPMQSAYGASKHALLGFTKALASEVWKDGIRVHMLSPGTVSTGMAGAVRPNLDADELIQPEELAEVALFLLTRKSAVIDEVLVHRPGKEPFA